MTYYAQISVCLQIADQSDLTFLRICNTLV
uniref:Uncharacterized protein n=1 Tax=Anguilla anguilla TaxID=7936 RepID=A0A0E9W0L0_ANGAN